ncbi:C2H2 finger domain protein, putative [Beauveria bassiana ARSEF 2860]|uniref:C2H2 finger domain protein, putative n=1 Tax=Beauveria bassiana (strain ARSEF 2860) TaxID=655819 RepID=J4UFY3_BEAB2|nr:C2H2 finger domain protein, putative [Beauveria bassiana ARSEF 2860]EJP61587.1 C2H2 finger domain protein, putative [Beauveria bassiana ARSEF 2860]
MSHSIQFILCGDANIHDGTAPAPSFGSEHLSHNLNPHDVVSPTLKRKFDNYSDYPQTTDENQGVAALLLSWEGESSARGNVLEVQRVLENDYRFCTQTFEIPCVENPITKLAAPLAAFLERANQSRLLVIYYTGYGFLDSSMQLCWARSAQRRSFRLKWAAICLIFEYTRADILLLLDTYFKFETIPSSHGLRQVIAAGQQTAPDSSNFTKCLIQALHDLHKSRTFFTGQLFADMTAIAKANNTSPFMMTPDTNNDIYLTPLPQYWPLNTKHRHAPFHSGLFAPIDLARGRQDANLASPPRVLPLEYKNSYPSSDSNSASRYLGYGSDSENGHAKGQIQSMAASRLKGRDNSGSVGNGGTCYRNVPCCFSFAGCKTEHRDQWDWRRHIEVVHLRFEIYRCLPCYENGNLKEYFYKRSLTKHLRRVHEGSHQDIERHVDSCRRTCRTRPEALSCPTKECVEVFRGTYAWERWTKHVWSHMILDHEITFECDTLLINYAAAAGIIEQRLNGKYVLCR